MHITPESPYCECYNVAYSVSASKQGQDLLLMDLIKYYKKKIPLVCKLAGIITKTNI